MKFKLGNSHKNILLQSFKRLGLLISALSLAFISSCGGSSGDSSNNEVVDTQSEWDSMQWDQDNWE